jgi:hypothetical protein
MSKVYAGNIMANKLAQKLSVVNLPISLDQLATGLRQLSHSELATLELLLDHKAMQAVQKSIKEVRRGKIRPLRV